MTDPFAPLGRGGEPPPNADYENNLDGEGPGYIRIPCRDCKSPCVRRQQEPFTWEHEDDEVVVRGFTLISASRYDHPANPWIIDATYRDDST